jgi:putative transposase
LLLKRRRPAPDIQDRVVSPIHLSFGPTPQLSSCTAVGEICRKAGISEATYYNWRKKYAGLTPSEMKRLRQLEEENGKLKKIVADLSLDKAMLQDVIRRKF